MNAKFETILSCIIITSFYMAISQHIYAEEKQQWQPVPEANYSDILELIELRVKSNYEGISSWQGRINTLTNRHYYNAQVAKLPMIDINSLSDVTRHICITDKILADFAVDMYNNKLYSNVEPNEQIKAIDLDKNVPFAKNTGSPSRTITILTQDVWMHHEPAYKYHSKLGKLPPKGRAEKTAFIDTANDVKGLNGDIQDPRSFFNSAEENTKIYETISKIRESLLKNGNVLISGYPHVKISSMKTENGDKYCVLTTWKGGENNAMKYVRSLIEVDEMAGFNATRVEISNSNGVILASKQYTYERFGDIFVPKTYRKELRNNKGEITSISEVTVETAGINKPLSEDTFSIRNLGVEEGMLVSDNIKKAEFRYSKGDLVPIADTFAPAGGKKETTTAEPNNPPK